MRATFALTAAILVAGCGSGSSGGSGSNPAATVNGHDISMAQYNFEVRSERLHEAASIGYDVCNVKGLGGACSAVKQRALGTLIGRELVQEYAKQRGIKVTSGESDRNWATTYRIRFDNMQAVLNAFLKREGESYRQVRQGLNDDLLQQKVLFAVTGTIASHVPAVRIAHLVAAGKSELTRVQQQFAAGQPFLGIAAALKKNSIKGCRQQGAQCGDLGWIPTDLIPPSRVGLTTGRAGSLVGPYLVTIGAQTDYELYYIELKDAHYAPTSKQSYSLRQQLFGQWLQKQETKAKVKRYVVV